MVLKGSLYFHDALAHNINMASKEKYSSKFIKTPISLSLHWKKYSPKIIKISPPASKLNKGIVYARS